MKKSIVKIILVLVLIISAYLVFVIFNPTIIEKCSDKRGNKSDCNSSRCKLIESAPCTGEGGIISCQDVIITTCESKF